MPTRPTLILAALALLILISLSFYLRSLPTDSETLESEGTLGLQAAAPLVEEPRHTGSASGVTGRPATVTESSAPKAPGKRAPLVWLSPTSPEELSAFLRSKEARYGSDLFYAAVEAVYQEEVRDEDWASKIEGVVSGGAMPVRGNCKASICIYRVNETGGTWQDDKQWRMSLRAASRALAFGEGDSKVEIMITWVGQYAGTMFILDREPPANYVEPLHQMLPD